jgi:hypothetical protein
LEREPFESWNDGHHADDVGCDQELEPQKYAAAEIGPVGSEGSIPFALINLADGPCARSNDTRDNDRNPENLDGRRNPMKHVENQRSSFQVEDQLGSHHSRFLFD